MDITEICCPNCHAYDIGKHTAYETKNNGERFIYKCSRCGVWRSVIPSSVTVTASENVPVHPYPRVPSCSLWLL